MPIRPYLAGRTFPAETIAVMDAALDEVCRTLKIGLDLGSRKMVARRIVALVDEGKTESDRISAVLINELGDTVHATV